MRDDDLERVKGDLETIEGAIGLSRAWGPGELRVTLLFVAAGLAAAAWALLARGASPLWGLTALVVPVAAWLRLALAPVERSAFARRDLRGALRTLWLAPPLAALFFWCRHAGLRPVDFLGLSTFLVGTVLLCAAAGDKSQRALWGWAVALTAGGLLLPIGVAPPAALLAAAIACGALGSAAAAYLDRRESPDHATS
jgi:hypothetical protein